MERIIERTYQRLEQLESEYQQSKPCYAGFKDAVRGASDQLLGALFPRHVAEECPGAPCRRDRLESGARLLLKAISYVEPQQQAELKTERFLDTLPGVWEVIGKDVQAAYEGDPAARSTDEILLAYPAFTAICIYRMAHQLLLLEVPLVPRMMTEYAHELTGIDIHPGATIGPYFFIDHGTGVVIGETTTIGHHVKLYQNVTLGAKSFEVGEDGVLVKGIKRHPDIGNRVVIYAGATILGGETRIGDGCVIGGNVWLTRSVEPGKQVVAQVSEHKIRDMRAPEPEGAKG